MAWLEELLGAILSNGSPLEMLGGLNFLSDFTLTPDFTNMRYDVSLTDRKTNGGATTHIRDKDIQGTYTGNVTFINCRIMGSITASGGTISFRGCSCNGAYAITSTSIASDRSSARAIQLAGTTVSTLPSDLDPQDPIYGAGGLGNVAFSAGTASISTTQVSEYANLTLSGTTRIQTNGNIVRVNGLLDLSACPANGLCDTGLGAGTDAAADVAGTAWGGSVGGGPLGHAGTQTGSNGAAGGTGAGATSAAATVYDCGMGTSDGQVSGRGGAGGTGVAAGGAIAAGYGFNARANPGGFCPAFSGVGVLQAETNNQTTVPVYGGVPGRGGSAGGGNNAAVKGGGGGGGGRGGGLVVVYARGIKTGTGTSAGAISALGAAGGKGGNGAADALATGGGGGGGGGTGGGVIVLYDWLLHSGVPTANNITASGGTGGTGGNGNGSGAAAGGDGGQGGAGGQIFLYNRITQVGSRTQGASGTAGTAHAGATGGAGGAGGACQATL